MKDPQRSSRVKKAPRRRGFTMIELTVSLTVTSILMVAIGSSIVIASHAIPNGSETDAETIRTSRGIDQLVAELQYATQIIEHTATAIEFVVLDRDSDAIDEIIRYEWSGTDGDPLTRQYKGGPLIVMAKDVTSFNLAYKTTTYEQEASAPVESAEVELTSFVPSSGLRDYAVDANHWIGQYFHPAHQVVEAMSWNVSRVLLRAKVKDDVLGLTDVHLMIPDMSNLPLTTVDTVSMLESDLSSTYGWHEIVFSNARNLELNTGLCLVLEWQGDKNSAEIEYSNTGTGRLLTSDAGVSWENKVAESMAYYVFGTYLTPGAIVEGYALRRVDVALQVNSDQDIVTHASVTMLNKPEVSSP